MFIYLGLIAYQLIMIFILKTQRYKSDFLIATVPFICIFILTAFRSANVGNDSENYLELFSLIRMGANLEALSERYEWGYLLFNKIVGHFFSNQYAIFFTTALFIYLISWIVIKKLSYKRWLSVFLFITLGLYSNSVNVIRLAMAYVVCLAAYSELEKNNYLKFIILVIFASLFHISAIVFLIALPCNKLHMKKRLFCVWAVITVIIYLLFNKILSIILNYRATYNTYVVNDIYFDSGYLATTLNICFWLFILVVVYILYRNRCFSLEEHMYIGKTKYLEKICIYGLIMISIYICGFKMNLMDRVAGYFRCLMIIFIPNALKEIENKRIQMLVEFCLVLIMLIFFVIPLIFRPEWTGIHTYSFWFDNN